MDYDKTEWSVLGLGGIRPLYRKLQFLFAVTSIISMQSVYTKLTFLPMDEILFFVSNLFLFILIIKGNLKITKPVFEVWCIFLFLMIFSLIYRFFFFDEKYNLVANFNIFYLFTVYLVLILMYFEDARTIRTYFLDFENIVFFLSLMSLIFFYFGQSLDIIPGKFSVPINWGGHKDVTSWIFLHFNAQGSPYGIFSQGRNTGIYAEAPQFTFILCMALIISIFKNKPNYFKVLIIILTILTTLSTTGQLVILLILASKIVLIKPKNKYIKFVKVFFSIFIGIIVAISFFKILNEKKNFGQSYLIRQSNQQSAISNFMKYPFFGTGFKSDSIGISSGNTSTMTQVIQDGGLVFLTIYFVGFLLSLIKSVLIKSWKICLIIVLYFILLYPTVITYTQLSAIIVGISITYGIGNLNIREIR